MSVSPAPMPSVRSASERAILLAALKDAVGKAYEQGRREAIAEMERAGSLKQGVTADDGESLGTISHADGKWVVDVDEAEVMAWCREHRAGEVVQLAAPWVVRPAFIDWLTADAITRAKDGQEPRPQAGNREGALRPVPGVKARWSPGNVTVSANQTAKERAAGILQGVFERGLPALNGEINDQHNPSAPSAVDRGDTEPLSESARTQLVLQRLQRYAAGPPDRAGGGADSGPGSAGPVVPRPAGGGDGGPEHASEELAGGLLDAVPGRVPYAYPLAFPDAVNLAVDLTHLAEPVRVHKPYADPDFDEPAPF